MTFFRKRTIPETLEADLDVALRHQIAARFQLLYWQSEVSRYDRKVAFIQKEILKWKKASSTTPSSDKPSKSPTP